MKTSKEHFENLPAPYRELALKNLDKYPLSLDTQENLLDSIAHSFSWLNSNEGEEFWERVYEFYNNRRANLPKLPYVWFNISSAPKDKPILGYWPHWSKDPVIIKWNEKINYWECENVLNHDDIGPTHWMPLAEIPN